MLEVSDSLIAATESMPFDPVSGYGASAVVGASMTLDRCAVVDNQAIGVLSSDASASVVLSGSLIAGTKPQPGGVTWGLGVCAVEGASLTLASSRSAFSP